MVLISGYATRLFGLFSKNQVLVVPTDPYENNHMQSGSRIVMNRRASNRSFATLSDILVRECRHLLVPFPSLRRDGQDCGRVNRVESKETENKIYISA